MPGRVCRAIHQPDRRPGLLPLSLHDLEKQRYRWCSGNVQTLMRHARTILTPTGSLSLHKRLVLLSQLTAWVSIALVPFLLLPIWLLSGQGQTGGAILAAGAIVLSLSDLTLRVVAQGLRDRQALPVLLQALACRIALAPQSAKASFDAFTGCRLEFEVTNKAGDARQSGNALFLPQLVVFATSALLLIGAQPAEPMIRAALLALLLPLPAAMVTDMSLRSYRAAINPPSREVSA